MSTVMTIETGHDLPLHMVFPPVLQWTRDTTGTDLWVALDALLEAVNRIGAAKHGVGSANDKPHKLLTFEELLKSFQGMNIRPLDKDSRDFSIVAFRLVAGEGGNLQNEDFFLDSAAVSGMKNAGEDPADIFVPYDWGYRVIIAVMNGGVHADRDRRHGRTVSCVRREDRSYFYLGNLKDRRSMVSSLMYLGTTVLG